MDTIICPRCGSADIMFNKKRQVRVCEECSFEFKAESSFHPLRVFISYGHDDHAALAISLKNDLEAKGHHTWFDEDRLKLGKDWERYIEDGLSWVSESPRDGRIILLMTPYSVRRPDGYCLNEITRAIQKKLNVIPVMVVWCEPPLSICRIQWLDMQDCVPIDGRIEKYRAKFDRLLDALEHDNLDYDGSQARLLRLLEPLPFDGDTVRHLARFTGRRWVFDRIDAWMNDPEASRIFWITGAPGSGKTAIASWLSANRREVVAFHLCRHGHAHKSDPRRCVLSLAYQLSTQLPEYLGRISALNLEVISKETNASTLFDYLFVQALAGDFPAPEGNVVILIDALDESSVDGQNELANFIATEFSKTPSWLRLIITSRPDPEVLHPLQGLSPYVLDTTSEENIRDIRDYLLRELKNIDPGINASSPVIDAIIEKSEGSFLYVDWVRQELEGKRLSLDRPDEFPRGLGSIYAQFFKRQFPDISLYEASILRALDLISAGQEPLSIDMIASALGWNDHELNKMERSLGSIFPVVDGHIRPFHKSLMDWLTDASRAGPYYVSIKEGHKKLAEFGWDLYTNDVEKLPKYMVAYLPTHLLRAGMRSELRTIMTDLAFIEAKCAAGLTYDLVRDYCATNDGPGSVMEYFERFVRTQSHILSHNPYLTLQQAANEPDGSPVVKAAAAFDERNKRPWLRLVNRSGMGTGSIMILNGHRDKVWSCSFSPDSAIVLSGSEDGSMKLWDTKTGKELKELKEEKVGIATCTISPDGRHIISGSWEGVLRLWDVASGKCISSWGPPAWHDGPATIKGEHMFLLGRKNSVDCCACSPDGELIIAGYEDGSLVVRNALSGDIVATLKKHEGPVRSCAVSPDGSCLISTSADKTAIIWDVRTWTAKTTLIGHMGLIGACAFAPSAERVITGSADGNVVIWDVSTGAVFMTLKGHSGPVNACAFSPDGRRVITGSADRALKLWDASSGQCLATFTGHTAGVEGCAFSGDGRLIVSASGDKTVRLWENNVPAVPSAPCWHDAGVNCCLFSPDGTKVLSGSDDGEIKLWDVADGACTYTLRAHDGRVRACAFSPDGMRFVSSSGTWQTAELKLWETMTGRLIGPLSGHTRGVYSCAFSPDGQRIVSGSLSRALKLWDASTGKEIASLAGHADSVEACVFSPDGALILSASRDKTLILWDGKTGKRIHHLRGHARAVKSCAFSPDGRLAVSGAADSTVRVWDMETGSCIQVLEGHSRAVYICAFSPDGKLILSGSRDRTMKLWDAGTGKVARTISGYMDSIRSCAFSPDGKNIVSESEDGFLKLWDVETGKLLCEYGGDGNILAADWSPDGRTLAAGDKVGRIHLLRLENVR